MRSSASTLKVRSLPNSHKVSVFGLTEVEAGKLIARLDYMRKSGIISGKVTYATSATEALDDCLRRSTYGGL